MLTKEELTDITKGLENLRQNNKSDLRESQVYSLTSYNQSISNINKHFFLIASLLIPFMGGLVGIDEIQKSAKKESPNWPIKMQGFLLFLALAWTVAIGIRLLY